MLDGLCLEDEGAVILRNVAKHRHSSTAVKTSKPEAFAVLSGLDLFDIACRWQGSDRS
jgi:hypothetical protein